MQQRIDFLGLPVLSTGFFYAERLIGFKGMETRESGLDVVVGILSLPQLAV